MADRKKEWQPPTEMTIGPLCWKLGEDGRYTFLDGAIGGRYPCGVSESLLVKRLAAALEDLDELREKVDSLQTCEAWLQKQVAERDAKIEVLRKQLDEYQRMENAMKSKAWEKECWNDE